MKNVILGLFGGLIIIYSIMIGLSIYTIQTRKNELQNCLPEIVEETLRENYVPPMLRTDGYIIPSSDKIENQILGDLGVRLSSDLSYSITILACDMDKGILSVRVDEEYAMPNGSKKKWHYAKTAIVE